MVYLFMFQLQRVFSVANREQISCKSLQLLSALFFSSINIIVDNEFVPMHQVLDLIGSAKVLNA